MMTFDDFLSTTEQADGCPTDLSLPLQALWYDKRNDWQYAHCLLGDAADTESAWVHAYLHRKEGDGENAQYWYNRANQPPCLAELDQEWQQIAQTLLDRERKD